MLFHSVQPTIWNKGEGECLDSRKGLFGHRYKNKGSESKNEQQVSEREAERKSNGEEGG